METTTFFYFFILTFFVFFTGEGSVFFFNAEKTELNQNEKVLLCVKLDCILFIILITRSHEQNGGVEKMRR